MAMTKQEFLDGLKAALSVHLSERAVEEHMRYYEEYINSQIRRGRAESEVLQQLGNPRLIARSIVEAGRNAQGNADERRQSYGEDAGQVYGTYGNRGYQFRRVPVWVWVLLAALLLVVLPLLLMFVWWLAPFVLMIWVIVMLVKMLKNSGHR